MGCESGDDEVMSTIQVQCKKNTSAIQAQCKYNTRCRGDLKREWETTQVQYKRDTSRMQARGKRDEKINMGGEEKCNDTSTIQAQYKYIVRSEVRGK